MDLSEQEHIKINILQYLIDQIKESNKKMYLEIQSFRQEASYNCNDEGMYYNHCMIDTTPNHAQRKYHCKSNKEDSTTMG